MLTTDKTVLEQVTSLKRLWQGIPSIAVTKKGRVFLTFYSGGTREEIGNFVVLIKSEDGVDFSEPVAVCCEKEHRCFDPCLWMDPLGRMWLTWSRCPDDGLYAAICDDPDAEELQFGEEFFVGHNIMMDKPTVLSTGEWAFPIAVWNREGGIRVLPKEYDWKGDMHAGSYMYLTSDQGKTFRPVGYSEVEGRSFDEHQFLEMQDGSIRVFVRTQYGIGASVSYDGGAHWSEGFMTDYGGPSSRFFIGRMPSGRVLMVNHYKYTGRNNLTAMLSDDDGKTFTHHLLLDGRNNVSYPDVQICEDGTLYICYDRERGGFQKDMASALGCAREVLYAKITEEDILAETLVSEGSFLQRVACKLTEYKNDDEPFDKYRYYTDYECACHLHKPDNADLVISEVLNTYQINCSNVHNVEAAKLDALVETYRQKQDLASLTEIIGLVRCASFEKSAEPQDVVHAIYLHLMENLEGEMDMAALAQKFNYSQCYIHHIFKRYSGTTIVEFRKAQRIIKAKLLLKGCDDKITDIAAACGFENPSYFTEVFTKSEGMSPTAYREIHR